MSLSDDVNNTAEASAQVEAQVEAEVETEDAEEAVPTSVEADSVTRAPLTLSENELDHTQELQLQYRWCLWFSAPKHKNADQKKWDTKRAKKVVEFGTVKEFWQVFNNLSPPTALEEGSDLNLFRGGVRPEWEDSFNAKGGTWKYTVSKDDANEKLNTAWFNTVLTMIGDQFHDADDICGVVTSIRAKVNRIGLWVKHADDREAVRRIGKQLKEVNRIKTRIYFISHDDAKDFSKPNKSSEMTL